MQFSVKNMHVQLLIPRKSSKCVFCQKGAFKKMQKEMFEHLTSDICTNVWQTDPSFSVRKTNNLNQPSNHMESQHILEIEDSSDVG